MKKIIAFLFLLGIVVGANAAQKLIVVPKVTIACQNLETFDGLKLVEHTLGSLDLKSELEHVIKTGACQYVFKNNRLKLKSSIIYEGMFGGKFYYTNEGYIATSNVRFE